MKSLLENIIRRKNSSFRFDPEITSRIILLLTTEKLAALIRGWIVFFFHLKLPQLVFVGSNVSFFNIANIEIGKWTKIDKGVHLSGLGKHKLQIGRGSGIGAYSQIIISTSFNNLGEYIRIGDNVGIGQFASIGGSGGVEIGNNCIIGQYFSCHPENHNFEDNDRLIRVQGTTRSPIKIGENCWIGAKVTVLAGVEIGKNCVIAAGSVVTKNIEENSVVAGVPAKILKKRI